MFEQIRLPICLTKCNLFEQILNLFEQIVICLNKLVFVWRNKINDEKMMMMMMNLFEEINNLFVHIVKKYFFALSSAGLRMKLYI